MRGDGEGLLIGTGFVGGDERLLEGDSGDGRTTVCSY